ncbi:MAG: M48 family peptidase, partial [Deltaproteobacteria bacterium]|nr:M48 family peptidase [Deltaproteobacteria bacterium]
MMKIMKKHLWLSFIILFFMPACSSVPITGRKQLNLIPSSSMLSMSFQQYDEFLKTHKLSNNQQQTQMVKRVGARLQKAVEQYFAEKNMAYKLSN